MPKAAEMFKQVGNRVDCQTVANGTMEFQIRIIL
jgi:hypothetical protein